MALIYSCLGGKGEWDSSPTGSWVLGIYFVFAMR